MNRLEQTFSDRVDFFVLDVDNPQSDAYMQQFFIRSRSTYVLLDANGNELTRWFGPLDETAVVTELNNILADLEE